MLWFVGVVLVVVGWIAWNVKASNELLDCRGKSVFISGCDSGMGYALALKLDKLGLKVFAACLTKEGASELQSKSSSHLVPIICDITNEEDVRKAAKTVEAASPNGLWALVNNAGIGYGGEWEWFPMKYTRRVMEVNFFGHVSVTRAFLPQLKKAKGRVVNNISAGGVVAIPGFGPYVCSKFAMEAFSDSLRREVKKWGISVYIVEPGITNTPMATNGTPMMRKIWGEVDEEFKEMYGQEYIQQIFDMKLPYMDPVERVVDVLQSKIINKYPTLRTPVGPVPKIGCILHNVLPTSWMDKILASNDKLPLPAVLAKK